MSVAEKMTAIADAIREKTGETGKLSLDGMAESLRKLPGPIVATASGNPISLTDATDLKLRGLKLFGKTTQNGTPTPEAPVPLVSAGDGGDIRTLILPAVKSLEDDTLCGIPVTSGGNYTDETGQQWICDEVDFGRGVYVQRIDPFVFTGNETIYSSGKVGSVGFYCFAAGRTVTGTSNTKSMCNYFKTRELTIQASDGNSEQNTNIVSGSDGALFPRMCIGHSVLGTTASSSESECMAAVKAWLKARYNEGKPLMVYSQLATPIETPLSTEELAAYAEKYGANTVAYGKTTQNGTPTPDAPVPLVNSTDIVQALLTSTPNGLPGIPVTSGGNYTDETGQQWVCDEVDFTRGVYVQRVHSVTLTDDLTYVVSGNSFQINESTPTQAVYNSKLFPPNRRLSNWGGQAHAMSDKFQRIIEGDGSNILATDVCIGIFIKEYRGIFVSVGTGSIEDLKNILPITLNYEPETPIETPLSAEELAAYAALHTNYPNTTIFNDGGAGMEVKYVADTKNYIDNQIAAVAAAIVNA